MARILLPVFIFGYVVTILAMNANANGLLHAFKGFILDDPPMPVHIMPVRPNDGKSNASNCFHTTPYHHQSLPKQIGEPFRVMANEVGADIENLSIQPHFSGLLGPKITIMRRDLERAVIDQQGSAPEIFHNAQFIPQSGRPCARGFNLKTSINLHAQVDVEDSDRAPLARTFIKHQSQLHFGGFFVGTFGVQYRLYNNLDREPDLFILDRFDPIRQDISAFDTQHHNVERAMLSAFATPRDNLYVGVHGGYLEETMAGFGGEILYRPFDKNFAVGAEAWSATKRIPYFGNMFFTDETNTPESYLINAWYDMPSRPLSFGLSAGRFLDGDKGVEFKTRWTPKNGWSAEGFITTTNEPDTSLDARQSRDIFAGLRLSMPLGQFKLLPDGSRATMDIMPLARDKAQKIDNPYPLYDLTNAWQAREIYSYWNESVE